jgi:hypothetical protein
MDGGTFLCLTAWCAQCYARVGKEAIIAAADEVEGSVNAYRSVLLAKKFRTTLAAPSPGSTAEPSETVTNADPMVISIPYYVPAPSLLDRLCRCGHALRHHEGEAGDPDTSCEECDCECWMPATEPEELCPRCKGRGEYVEREDMTWDCPRCDGTGRVSKEAPSPSAAPAPAGGDLIGEPCPNCRGNGEIHHLTGGVSSCDDCNSTGRLAPKEGT